MNRRIVTPPTFIVFDGHDSFFFFPDFTLYRVPRAL